MQSTGNSIPIPAASSARLAGWQGQWMGIGGLLILLGFSWLPNSYTRMMSWPYALIWQAAFGLWIGWSLWMSRQFSLPLRQLGYGLDWIVLLAVCSCGLSALSAEFREVAYWNGLLFFNYVVVFYAVVNWLRHSPALRHKLWFALALSGTVTHLISLLLWQPNLEMWLSRDFSSAIRNPLPLGHHNFVGGYCLLMLPLITGFAFTQQRPWQRRLGYGAIAINLVALYASGSRGSLLGATVLGLLALLLYCFYTRPKQVKHRILIALFLLIILGALASNHRVRSLFSFESSAAPISSIPLPSIEQIADGPTRDRLFMLQAAQQIFKDYPVLGIGPGNLSRLYNLYRPIEVGNGLETVQQLHNTPAQLAAEMGAIGLIIYAALIGWLIKTSTRLQRTISSDHASDRILLYSISASWFAYLISSLTDYQLENIGISIILLLNTALLVALADKYSLQTSSTALTTKTRRLLSMGLLLVFSLTIQAWARTNAALYLSHAAQKDAERFDYAAADAKWTKASQLSPWDPTYAAISAEQLINIQKNTSSEQNKSKLRDAAIASLKAALQAAPNDPWLHQNVAVLLLPTDPLRSQAHLQRTAQLFPRGPHHTYYTLGRSYLSQNKQAKAITAFALESLTYPQFLTAPLWETEPFAPLLPSVLSKTLAIEQAILSTTTPSSPQHSWLQQQIALTQWWHQKPITTPDKVDSIAKAIFAIEDNPDDASERLRQIIATESQKTAAKALLLLSWQNPEESLPPSLFNLDISNEDRRILNENTYTIRDFRKWLSALTQPAPEKLRFALSYAYRNAAASNIRTILYADRLSNLTLLNYLELFPAPPREFSQLDRTIVEIAQQELHIPFDREPRFQTSL